MNSSSISFLGGAGSVTGANFLLESADAKILVDCGLFQGCEFCEESNWKEFAFEPASIQTLIITHSHIDHIGRIPRLVRQGFRGTILSTEATRSLAEPLLHDALEVMNSRHGTPLHPEPLYEEKDIAQALSLWRGISYHEKMPLQDGFELEFLDAGHILGSAMARLSRDDKNIIFTGDLGGDSLLLPARESLKGATYLVMESVYGDRVHVDAAPEVRRGKLLQAIQETTARGGTLLIPAFATERTQDVLFDIRSLFIEGKIQNIPVYLDSPLAERMTEVFLRYPNYFNEEMKGRIASGENIFSFPELHIVHSTRESHTIGGRGRGKVIIAGSGMSSGGRILAHEKEILPDEKSEVLMVGYQAAGSLGRKLLEGVKKVFIEGEAVKVRCHIDSDMGYSAHLDGPHLLDAAKEAEGTLKKAFVVMGEPASAGYLAQHMRDYLGVEAVAPEGGYKATLEL